MVPMAFALSKKQALLVPQLSVILLGISLSNLSKRVSQTVPFFWKILLIRLCIESMVVSIVSLLLVTAGLATILSHIALDQSPQQLAYLSLFGTVNLMIFVTGLCLLGGLYVMTSTLLSITTILGLSPKYQMLSIAHLFEMSASRFFSFFFTQVFSIILILGGFFAFVLPGIGMMVFFSFVPFVVLFEKKNGIAALQQSIRLVASQPLVLSSRLLLLWIGGIGLNVFLCSGVFHFLGFMSFIFLLVSLNIVYGWFSTMYAYMLYTKAKHIHITPSSQYRRVFALSISGWLLAVILGIWMYGILTTATSMIHQQEANQSYSLPRMSHSIKEI